MGDGFKVPTLETKIKFIPRKTAELPTRDDTEPVPADTKPSESKNIPEVSDESEVREEKAEKSSTSTSQSKPSAKLRPKCPYAEPKWSQIPSDEHKYDFEILKNGLIVETVRNLQSKSYWTMGKLPENDIVMAHPTISRFHAVLQYRPEIKSTGDDSDSDNDDENDATAQKSAKRSKPMIEKGWYLYDLSSTHGCFVNKMKIPPKTYVRLRVGYMLKFGSSTRSYILQGPDFDEEAESELTITEMKELRRQKELEQQEKLLQEEQKREDEGVSWGMQEDADEETDLSHNPFASTNNEELFLQDPKKTLRGFFEREGCDLEYKCDELSTGSFICRIELPITDSNGRNIVAEVSHKGKKKECVLQGALEACRILDRQGVLRQANHEPMKRRKVESSDDDDDEFYDRTTEAEEKRKRKSGSEQVNAKTYAELLEDEENLLTNLADLEQKIVKYQETERRTKEKKDETDEDLDDFMLHLSSEKQLDKTEIRKLKFEVQRIKTDHIKLQRLIKIARPIDLPPIVLTNQSQSNEGEKAKKLVLPLFGKKGTFSFKTSNPVPAKKLKTDEINAQPNIAESQTDETDAIEETEDSVGVENTSEKSPKVIVEKKERKEKKDEALELPECDKEIDDVTDVTSKDLEGSPDVEMVTLESEIEPTTASVSLSDDSLASKSKKKRSRNRTRNDKNRERIDFDDAEENADATKYSGWVPPENQSGDGLTDLNSKYGY